MEDVSAKGAEGGAVLAGANNKDQHEGTKTPRTPEKPEKGFSRNDATTRRRRKDCKWSHAKTPSVAPASPRPAVGEASYAGLQRIDSGRREKTKAHRKARQEHKGGRRKNKVEKKEKGVAADPHSLKLWRARPAVPIREEMTRRRDAVAPYAQFTVMVAVPCSRREDRDKTAQ